MVEIKHKYEAKFINFIFGLDKKIGDILTSDEVRNNHDKNRIMNFLKSQSIYYDIPLQHHVTEDSIKLWINNKGGYLTRLNNYYKNSGLDNPIDKIKDNYGFKYNKSLLTALTLFPTEKEDQIKQRYFVDFFDVIEIDVILEFADKHNLNNHIKMKDILIEDFTIDKLQNYISSSTHTINNIADKLTALDNLCERFSVKEENNSLKKLMKNYNVDSPLALVEQVKQTQANNRNTNTNERKNAIVEPNLRITREKKKISKNRKVSNIPLPQKKIIAKQHDFEKLVQNVNQQQPVKASTSTYVEGGNINQMQPAFNTTDTFAQPGQVVNQTVNLLQDQLAFNGQLDAYNNLPLYAASSNNQQDMLNNPINNNPWTASSSNNPQDLIDNPGAALTNGNQQNFSSMNYPQPETATASTLTYVTGTSTNQMPQTQLGQFVNTTNNYYVIDSNTGNPVNVDPGIYYFIGNDVNGNAIYVKQPNDQSNIQQNTQTELPVEQISTEYPNTVNSFDTTNNYYLIDPITRNPVNVDPGIYYLIGYDDNGSAIYVKQQNNQSNIQQNTQSVLPGAQISTEYPNTVNSFDTTNNFANQQQAYVSDGQNMGPYYNSNQHNFMNYNNLQGF